MIRWNPSNNRIILKRLIFPISPFGKRNHHIFVGIVCCCLNGEWTIILIFTTKLYYYFFHFIPATVLDKIFPFSLNYSPYVFVVQRLLRLITMLMLLYYQNVMKKKQHPHCIKMEKTVSQLLHIRFFKKADCWMVANGRMESIGYQPYRNYDIRHDNHFFCFLVAHKKMGEFHLFGKWVKRMRHFESL